MSRCMSVCMSQCVSLVTFALRPGKSASCVSRAASAQEASNTVISITVSAARSLIFLSLVLQQLLSFSFGWKTLNIVDSLCVSAERQEILHKSQRTSTRHTSTSLRVDSHEMKLRLLFPILLFCLIFYFYLLSLPWVYMFLLPALSLFSYLSLLSYSTSSSLPFFFLFILSSFYSLCLYVPPSFPLLWIKGIKE